MGLSFHATLEACVFSAYALSPSARGSSQLTEMIEDTMAVRQTLRPCLSSCMQKSIRVCLNDGRQDWLSGPPFFEILACESCHSNMNLKEVQELNPRGLPAGSARVSKAGDIPGPGRRGLHEGCHPNARWQRCGRGACLLGWLHDSCHDLPGLSCTSFPPPTQGLTTSCFSSKY